MSELDAVAWALGTIMLLCAMWAVVLIGMGWIGRRIGAPRWVSPAFMVVVWAVIANGLQVWWAWLLPLFAAVDVVMAVRKVDTAIAGGGPVPQDMRARQRGLDRE